MSGAEFGTLIPGREQTDYTWNSEPTFAYFASKGLNLLRVGFKWERLQPRLRGPLDPQYLAGLKRNAAWARKHGLKLVIQPHNFARYTMNGREYILDNAYDGAIPVSTLDLIDFWERVSEEFKDEDSVWGYDLMNEPHHMGSGNWKVTSQAVLSAIRNRGDTKRIMIPGDDWSSASRWVQNHGYQSWIVDPADNFSYEAHLYFDWDHSGSYEKAAGYATSYDSQLARNPSLATVGVTRVRGFLDWCRDNGARGFLGEYGIPNDDPRWLEVLRGLLGALDEAKMDGAYWSAGDWWGDYKLSVQPRNGQDRVQLPALLEHRGAAIITSVSAANGYVTSTAPDSLVSAYGVNLTAEGEEVRIEVRDSAGTVRPGVVLYASPTQVNYLLPEGVALGRAEATLYSAARVTALGSMTVRRIAPALFDVAQFVTAGERRYLILYGTGIRGGSGATARVGEYVLLPEYAGKQPEFLGLDQINIALPAGLSGAVDVTLHLEGLASNTLRVVL